MTLKERICFVLASGKHDCLYFAEIKKKLRERVDRLHDVLGTLVEDGEVRYVGDRYCLMPRSLGPPRLKLGYGIMKVAGTKGRVTTAELARELQSDARRVSRLCHSLAINGCLARGEPSKRRLFFAPITGETIHASNYDRINELYSDLRRIIAEHNLRDPALKSRLQGFFGKALMNDEYARYNASINSFRNDLLKTVDTAKKKSDVFRLLGLRPFYRDVTTWKTPA
jgi:hypothetical protein